MQNIGNTSRGKPVNRLRAWIKAHKSEFISTPVEALPAGRTWSEIAYLSKKEDRRELLFPNNLFIEIAGNPRKAQRLKRSLRKAGFMAATTRNVLKRVLFVDGDRKYVVVIDAGILGESGFSIDTPHATMSPKIPLEEPRLQEEPCLQQADCLDATMQWTKAFLEQNR